MRPLRISENVVPVSEFKAQTAEWLRKAAETGSPVIVTQNGRPAGVVLSPQAFDELNERARFLEAIDEGLFDADSGRVSTHADAVRRLTSRYAQRSE